MNMWTKIKLYAEKKEREDWMNKHFCDQKCPHCDTWQANCGGWAEVINNFPTSMNDKTKCGKCGQWTTWFDFGMGFAVADDETGEPLK